MDITLTEAEHLLGLEISDYNSDAIDRLEAVIIDCNNAANNPEIDTKVDDAVYDRLREILTEVKPESELLNTLWSAEGDITDHTELLRANPMMSIQTVKDWGDQEYTDFLERLDETHEDGENVSLILSYKLNGHGVRVVYQDGQLVSATSRARASAGNDLTRQLTNILGSEVEQLKGLGKVEIRGELVLHESNLSKAREFNPGIKSLFSGVSSLVRRYSTEEENALLEFIAYRAISSNGIEFSSKDDEYSRLESWGFTIPENFTMEIKPEDGIHESIVSGFETLEGGYESYGYFCDGVVVEVNLRDEFFALGTAGVRAYGNVALKVGKWAQDMYTGIVQYIEFTPGKKKLSPVAIVATESEVAEFDYDGKCVNFDQLGVLTAQGNSVKRVPLYEPRNILILEAYEGRPLNFRYGGEAGVVPVTQRGELLKDDALRQQMFG